MTRSRHGRPETQRLSAALVIVLVLFTTLTLLPVVRNGFVSFDDPEYITANPRILQGLTADNLRWAFTTYRMGSWHPLTWLSHMIDGRLYGLDPIGHHITNLVLHVTSTLLLFLILKGMTGAQLRSGVVAALFALHPLHVESVAWASERKDVLAGFFWMLTMGAYLRYVQRPAMKRYLPVVGGLALGLMSKPLTVTLPFVLLLLDFWPLGRLKYGQVARWKGVVSDAARLLLEKLPLIGLVATTSVITYLTQLRSGTIPAVPGNTTGVRIGRVLVSYARYLEKTFWPADLSVFYPYHLLRQADWLGAAAVLVAATIVVSRFARTRPYLIVGWLWFLGTLLPMIGLVQVGSQGIADRYTYIPLTGIFLLGTWGCADLLKRLPVLRWPVGAGLAILLLSLASLSYRQAGYWRSTVTLFRHAVAVMPDNNRAKLILAQGLTEEGRLDEANGWLLATLRANPNTRKANFLVGMNLYRLGRQREAIHYFSEEARIDPNNPAILFFLGSTSMELNENEAARRYFRQAIRLDPRNSDALTNLGVLAADAGDWLEALDWFEQALSFSPADPIARTRAREARVRLGK